MTPDDRDLSDERTLRLRAEARLAQEVERTKLWRRRAEERQTRIDELQERLRNQEARPKVVKWAAAVRRAARSSPEPAPGPARTAVVDDTTKPRPQLASVSVAAIAAHPSIVPVLDEATRLDPIADRGALAAADVVVVDNRGWSQLDEPARNSFRDALTQPGRPPLLVWTEGDSIEELAGHANAVLTLAPSGSLPFLAGSYRRRPPQPDRDRIPVAAEDLARPNTDLIGWAAKGSPVVLGSDPADPDVAGHRALRWAFRHHRPSLRLSELLDVAGVSHRHPAPSVAAVLVSNRPDLIRGAVSRLAHQTWRPLELIVGMHGFDDPGLAPPTDDVPMRILRFDERVTLGECLNRAIESTGADLVAKIDDDDHYGPAYLEDAVRDRDSSGQPIVGKATVYAYLASDDTTVLRRPGTEHRPIDGTMGGNTFVVERSIWEAVPFPHRPRFVDTIFLTAARRLGITAYSGSRFEFCAVRHGTAHTYAASDTLLSAGSEVAWRGLHPERAFVSDLEAAVSP